MLQENEFQILLFSSPRYQVVGFQVGDMSLRKGEWKEIPRLKL